MTVDNAFIQECSDFLLHPVFLPLKNPRIELPYPFDIYSKIFDGLSSKSQSTGGYRGWIENSLISFQLSKENINILNSEQQENLWSVLSILCHCYRWNYVPPAPEVYKIKELTLPKALWEPFCWVADLLKAPYCGTSYSTTTSNFNIKGLCEGAEYRFNEVSFEDFDVRYSWLAQEHEKELVQWIKIFVVTEMEGGYANTAGIHVLQGVFHDDLNAVKIGLKQLLAGIQRLTKIFGIHVRGAKLNTTLWRNVVQPVFIWGLASDPKSALALEGASGLQVGCIQLIDLVLGTQMESAMGRAMIASRAYMPQRFRLLFNALEPYRNSLVDFVRQSENNEIIFLYNQCLDAIKLYRVSHMQRGKVYIKGDGSEKLITTTGLSIKASDSAVLDFEKDMLERIQEINQPIHSL
jgi:Indoleamine 2,3-dioxygenase